MTEIYFQHVTRALNRERTNFKKAPCFEAI